MTDTPQNHQVVFAAQGIVNLEPRDLPPIGANDLLIRTRVSLISPGTERAFFLGLPNTSQTYPQLVGYSNIGEIVQCGENASDFAVGDRVASAAHHAAFVAVTEAASVRVPAGLSDEQAVFFNLTAIALQGVRKARIELGEPVIVIGAGLIGLLAAELAKLNGALPVISVDRDARRLEFATVAGADATLAADDRLLPAVAELCDGEEGANVVIEATGHPQAILTAFSLAKPGGRVVLLGSTRGETEQVNFYRDVHRKGLTVIGAHNIARPRGESRPGWWTEKDDQRVALKLLARGRLSVQDLITHRYAWQQATQAYDLLKQWDHNALGLLLDWRV